MEVCIHRGAKEIGGSCVEVASGGHRLIIDLGLPLDADEVDKTLLDNIPGLLPVKGMSASNTQPLAVIISHPHLDHYGLLPYINPAIPVIMGTNARWILNASEPFMHSGWSLPVCGQDLISQESFVLGPFKITPYLVDHSAYDAYSLLIEADGRSLLYSGDLRMHGRKRILSKGLGKLLSGKVDTLIMEGTTINGDNDRYFQSETMIEERMVQEFHNAEGMVLVNTSSQNIDRIVSIFRACRRTGKTLVIDLYTAAVLAATGNNNIPQSDWPGISLYIPQRQRVLIKNKKLFGTLQEHSKNRIYLADLEKTANNTVLLFRPLHIRDLRNERLMENARFIYSQWSDYSERKSFDEVRDWLDAHNIKMTHIHTSGHASIPDLQELVRTLNPGCVVPIHTNNPESFNNYFSNVTQHADGEKWYV